MVALFPNRPPGMPHMMPPGGARSPKATMAQGSQLVKAQGSGQGSPPGQLDQQLDASTGLVVFWCMYSHTLPFEHRLLYHALCVGTLGQRRD